jgi:hypothetical protein
MAAACVPVEAQLFEHGLGRGQLVFGAVVHMLDAERLEPYAQRLGIAPGDHRRRDARALQQLEAVAVEDAEALEGFAVLGEIDAAVGQHAVDVEEGHAHILRGKQGLGLEIERHQMTFARIRSLMLSAPHKCPASTTSTLVMRYCSINAAASTASASARSVRGPGCITSRGGGAQVDALSRPGGASRRR